MAVLITGKMKPSGSFPLADAEDILMPDGTRLNEFEGGATEEQIELVTQLANDVEKMERTVELLGDSVENLTGTVTKFGKRVAAIETTMAAGTVGQIAVSDGNGGITWLTVIDGNEVAF